MSSNHRSISSRIAIRGLVAVTAVAVLVTATGFGAARAGLSPFETRGVAAQPAGQNSTLQPFEAVGLPSGRAAGVPSILKFPKGFSLKHIHGGPTYVYVLAGVVDILDADGSHTTYRAGDFFSEAPGHIHTITVVEDAQVFTLQFLVPGSEATVPVQ
jgi:hypothetical protein